MNWFESAGKHLINVTLCIVCSLYSQWKLMKKLIDKVVFHHA